MNQFSSNKKIFYMKSLTVSDRIEEHLILCYEQPLKSDNSFP